MSIRNFDFNKIVSLLVQEEVERYPEISIYKFSSAIGTGTSFFRKCLRGEKKFNVKHLFFLSYFLGIDINKFLPSKQNLNELYDLNLSDKAYKDILTDYLYGSKAYNKEIPVGIINVAEED